MIRTLWHRWLNVRRGPRYQLAEHKQINLGANDTGRPPQIIVLRVVCADTVSVAKVAKAVQVEIARQKCGGGQPEAKR